MMASSTISNICKGTVFTLSSSAIPDSKYVPCDETVASNADEDTQRPLEYFFNEPQWLPSCDVAEDVFEKPQSITNCEIVHLPSIMEAAITAQLPHTQSNGEQNSLLYLSEEINDPQPCISDDLEVHLPNIVDDELDTMMYLRAMSVLDLRQHIRHCLSRVDWSQCPSPEHSILRIAGQLANVGPKALLCTHCELFECIRRARITARAYYQINYQVFAQQIHIWTLYARVMVCAYPGTTNLQKHEAIAHINWRKSCILGHNINLPSLPTDSSGPLLSDWQGTHIKTFLPEAKINVPLDNLIMAIYGISLGYNFWV